MTKVDKGATREEATRPGGFPGAERRDRLRIYDDERAQGHLPEEDERELFRHGKFGTRKEIDDMHRKAKGISRFLKTIGNDVRLLVLCHLIQHKELTVGELMAKIPPTSQSSLSQHLAKMRELGLITYRRDSQTLHYRIRDPRVIQVLSTLKKVFCDDMDEEIDLPIPGSRLRSTARGSDSPDDES